MMAFFVVLVINYLANAIPIGGQTTGEVSAKYPSLFTPAGFTFAIWGVIYLGLLIYVIFQALPQQRELSLLADINKWFIINCIANASWILAWQYDFLVFSILIMAIILATLIIIYRKLASFQPKTPGIRLLVMLPFSIYIGWITVASIANISVLQTAFGWDDAGLSAIDWTLLKLSIAGAIAAIMAFRFRNVAFVLVIAWAAFGIAAKQIETPVVVGAAKALLGISLLMAAYQIFTKVKEGKAAKT